MHGRAMAYGFIDFTIQNCCEVVSYHNGIRAQAHASSFLTLVLKKNTSNTSPACIGGNQGNNFLW